MNVRLTTLGGFAVYKDGVEEPALLSWRRRLAILTFMGMEGEATRDQLVNLFWPEKEAERGRHSLSQALYEIRQACGSECLLSQGEWVRAAPSLEVDAKLFEGLASANQHRDALPYYKGEFLSGVHLVEVPDFEHWVDRTQSRLRRLHRASRNAVIQELLDAGKTDHALGFAREWVEVDPLEDEAQHRFIEILARSGRRSEALRQFAVFEKALTQEDLEPLNETQVLVDKIRSGEEIGPLKDPPPNRALETQLPAQEEEDSAIHGREARRIPLPTPAKEWITALKERWVFRFLITYAAALFVWIQLGDALISVFSIPRLTILRITNLGLALMPAIAVWVWAFEPWFRGRRAKPKGGSGTPVGLYFHFRPLPRGVAAVVATLGSAAFAASSWPAGELGQATEAVVERPGTQRHGFAILPIQSEATTDAFLASVGAHLTRSLINHFRNFDVLNVPSEDRVARYGTDRPPPDTILSQLGVELLLCGRLGRRGDSLLVSFDLESQGESGGHMEARVPVSGGLNELEFVQLASEKITDRLKNTIRGEFRARELKLGTQNPVAWEMVQQGEDERRKSVSLLARGEIREGAAALAMADSLLAVAAELDPDWPDPLVLRGFLAVLRYSMGRIAESVDASSDLILSPGAASRVLMDGLNLIEEGLALDPANKEGLYRKAELLRFLSYQHGSNPDSMALLTREMEAALQAAIRGDPPRPDAMLRLAQLYYDRDEYEEADRLYESAYERDVFLQDLPSDILNRGRARLETGKEALGFRECQSRGAGRETWNLHMSQECQLLLLAFGQSLAPDTALARKLLEENAGLDLARGVEAGTPLPRMLTLYAAVLYRAGSAERARVIQRAALGEADGHGNADYETAMLILAGDTTQAMALIRETPNLPLHSRLFAPLDGYPPFDTLAGHR